MRFLSILFLLALAAPAAHAQEYGRVEQTQSNVVAYYYFVEPGEATVQVSAIGAVRHPGLYEVSTGTDLRKLLVLAGGPILDVRNSRSDRNVRVMLLRSGSSRPVYEAPLGEAVSGQYPVLQEGDTVLVEVLERERFGWRDAFTIVGGLSAVAFIIQAVAEVSR